MSAESNVPAVKPPEKKFLVVVAGEYYAEHGGGHRRAVRPYSVSFTLGEKENRALGFLIAKLPAEIRKQHKDFVSLRTHAIESETEVK